MKIAIDKWHLTEFIVFFAIAIVTGEVRAVTAQLR